MITSIIDDPIPELEHWIGDVIRQIAEQLDFDILRDKIERAYFLDLLDTGEEPEYI